MKQELAEGLNRLDLELSSEQHDKLLRFTELLATRGIEIGAVAKSDRDRVLRRHVLDSLRAAPLIGEADRIGYDFGSGGGLPGIPLAIARPRCALILVESRHWRTAFLEMVVAELDVNARVERARVETMGVQADLALARAFAPLPKAWELASRVLKPGGRLIFFAGAALHEPEAAARAAAGDDVAVQVFPNVLAHGGPLVIMSRSA